MLHSSQWITVQLAENKQEKPTFSELSKCLIYILLDLEIHLKCRDNIDVI